MSCCADQVSDSFLSLLLSLCLSLGKVEMVAGIHAVFRGMPLMWTPGYLGQALAIMERVAAAPGERKLSKDAVRCLLTNTCLSNTCLSAVLSAIVQLLSHTNNIVSNTLHTYNSNSL